MSKLSKFPIYTGASKIYSSRSNTIWQKINRSWIFYRSIKNANEDSSLVYPWFNYSEKLAQKLNSQYKRSNFENRLKTFSKISLEDSGLFFSVIHWTTLAWKFVLFSLLDVWYLFPLPSPNAIVSFRRQAHVHVHFPNFESTFVSLCRLYEDVSKLCVAVIIAWFYTLVTINVTINFTARFFNKSSPIQKRRITLWRYIILKLPVCYKLLLRGLRTYIYIYIYIHIKQYLEFLKSNGSWYYSVMNSFSLDCFVYTVWQTEIKRIPVNSLLWREIKIE